MSTEISWTDETWNPTTGCDRVSPGCDHCYAMTLAKRLKGMGSAKYQRDGDPRTSGPGFGLTVHPDALDIPIHWRKPRRVFVNSMSDLFHPDVPASFIRRVWSTMSVTPRHTYQILTKRPQRMAKFMDAAVQEWGEGLLTVLPNVWLGTSVENQRYADLRIPHLLATPAAVRFLSIEPLLGPVDLSVYLGAHHERSSRSLPQVRRGSEASACRERSGAASRSRRAEDGIRAGGESNDPLRGGIPPEVAPSIDWVIVGGESGPGARPMEREWAENIVEQCQAAGVAVFVKQLGTLLGGKHHQDIDTFPAGLQRREFPR